MPELPTGTVTLLFTDIEGSTRLLQQLGPRYADVLADQRALLRAAWAAHHGHEVDTQGDSFFVAFARAADAVAAAAQAQRALARHAGRREPRCACSSRSAARRALLRSTPRDPEQKPPGLGSVQ